MTDETKTETTEPKAEPEVTVAEPVEVVVAPPPGSDPDTKQRTAKALAAMGIDPLPEGYSVDPITDEDREAYVAECDKAAKDAAKDDEANKKDEDDAKAGRAAAPTRVQGRTAPSRTKAAE